MLVIFMRFCSRKVEKTSNLSTLVQAHHVLLLDGGHLVTAGWWIVPSRGVEFVPAAVQARLGGSGCMVYIPGHGMQGFASHSS